MTEDSSVLAVDLLDSAGSTHDQARAALLDLIHSMMSLEQAPEVVLFGMFGARSLQQAIEAAHQAGGRIQRLVLIDPVLSASEPPGASEFPGATEIDGLIAQARDALMDGGSLLIATTALPSRPNPTACEQADAGPLHSLLIRTLLEQGFAVRRDRKLGPRAFKSYRRLLRRIADSGDPDEVRSSETEFEGAQAARARLEAIAAQSAVDYRLLHATKDRYRIERYRPGDETSILELFEQSFHVSRTVEHWRWKYLENPYGNLKLSLGRDPQGLLVSQYAAYPVHLYSFDSERRRGKTEPIHQVGDTMTAPGARHVGRGVTSVLARTVRHFYGQFCEGQVAFNYGFNTSKIQRFTLRVGGGEKIEEVPYRRLNLSTRPLSSTGSTPARYRIERVESISDEFDRLYRSTRDRYRRLVERDARYLRWRYLARPDVDYRLYAAWQDEIMVGWGVFVNRGEELVWGDALFEPTHTKAVGSMLRVAAHDHAAPKAIVGWFPPRPAWFDVCLQDLGFDTQPEPQTLAMLAVPFLDPSMAAKLRRDFYYTYGDSDLF